MHVLRNGLVLQDVHAPVFDVVVGDGRDGRGIGDAADEQQRRQDHADFDRHRQIGEHGEREGDQPDARCRSWSAGAAPGSRATRPCCRRPPSGSRPAPPAECNCASGAANEQDHQQRERVDHARDRRLRAGADVGRGAGDRAGRRQSAEHRRDDVGDALRDQFDVGLCRSPLMRSATTADISDSIAPSIATVRAGTSRPRISSGRNVGRCERRQAARNAAEARADGLDRQAEARHRRPSQHQRHDRAGNALRAPRSARS